MVPDCSVIVCSWAHESEFFPLFQELIVRANPNS